MGRIGNGVEVRVFWNNSEDAGCFLRSVAIASL